MVFVRSDRLPILSCQRRQVTPRSQPQRAGLTYRPREDTIGRNARHRWHSGPFHWSLAAWGIEGVRHGQGGTSCLAP